MTRKTLTEEEIKSKYNSISECLAICYIQSKRILEDAEILNMDTKPIKDDLACFHSRIHAALYVASTF